MEVTVVKAKTRRSWRIRKRIQVKGSVSAESVPQEVVEIVLKLTNQDPGDPGRGVGVLLEARCERAESLAVGSVGRCLLLRALRRQPGVLMLDEPHVHFICRVERVDQEVPFLFIEFVFALC